MNELALFAGAGGGILGGAILGWRTVCAVEFDAYARRVLLARQRDGCLPRFPIWDDVRTFDGRPWRCSVDVVSGGFPCQDISCAGKGAGIEGERSGLWKHMARIVGEVRPRFVCVENSPLLIGRGLAVVLGDLAALGYDARWGVVGAHHVGAPHKRDRVWVLADANCGDGKAWPTHTGGQSTRSGSLYAEETRIGQFAGDQGASEVADTNSQRLEERRTAIPVCAQHAPIELRGDDRNQWWQSEPSVGRMAYGVAHRVDRLRCIGNGQVPQAMALAWDILTGDMKGQP